MTWFSNRPAARTLAGTGALGMAVALTSVFGMPVAAAAPIPLKYDVQGAAHVVKMNTDIPIDATYALNFGVSTGKFDGEFKQKEPAHVKFKAFGSFDSELDVEFSQAGPSGGQFKDSKVTMDLPLQVKIRNLVAVGYPGMVGE